MKVLKGRYASRSTLSRHSAISRMEKKEKVRCRHQEGDIAFCIPSHRGRHIPTPSYDLPILIFFDVHIPTQLYNLLVSILCDGHILTPLYDLLVSILYDGHIPTPLYDLPFFSSVMCIFVPHHSPRVQEYIKMKIPGKNCKTSKSLLVIRRNHDN
ncbi:hypothetical protein IEQ34_015526 [Dendrobium chrysotoxum]|uniref:Uncharacterized protein n=1 Tax=Dendrobium chrysotoxum TaxID=161865 RepID=A0AAV7GIP4_DENCH|nr:hypothetical protein IEQ34_015526 [Dendrobium chrysotoxum]